MPGSIDDQLGFAPDYDSPVPYMQRTRDYYTAIGYTTPYRWAHYADAPFQPLKKPLAQSRVTIITTAAPYDPAKGDQGPGAAYNGGATFYVDAPESLARCLTDAVDVAVLVPNCPVCHQTSALVARHLEAGGISTVVMGCAKDIVEHAAVPRFLFSDFPLGNSAGKPHDIESQALTLELALGLLEHASGARTTLPSPLPSSADPPWTLAYHTIPQLN